MALRGSWAPLHVCEETAWPWNHQVVSKGSSRRGRRMARLRILMSCPNWRMPTQLWWGSILFIWWWIPHHGRQPIWQGYQLAQEYLSMSNSGGSVRLYHLLITTTTHTKTSSKDMAESQVLLDPSASVSLMPHHILSCKYWCRKTEQNLLKGKTGRGESKKKEKGSILEGPNSGSAKNWTKKRDIKGLIIFLPGHQD